MSWDEFNLKAAPTQMQLLQRAIGEKLGIKVTVDHSGKGASKGAIPYRVAIDQMLDAFHNITGMAAVLGLPEKAMSLGGTLTLHLQKSASFYGAFYPGEQKIALPGRSNSFAHEWGHALDFYLLGKHTSGEGRGLSGRTRQKGASGVQPTEMAGHFANLMNAMFFDRAGLATKIMALEAKAAAASSPSVKAQIGKQIQRIVEGAGQHRDGRSNFYAGAKGYHAPSEEYWTSPTEMMARSFEAYVAAKAEAAGMSTEVISHSDADYLSDADERLAKTFPKGEERNAIFSAFDDLFDGLVRSEELGAGKAAEVPDNPARRPDATPERVSALRNIVNAELAPWRDAARSRSKAAGQPKDRKGILSKAEDMRRYLFSSMAAELRGLGRRWKSKTIAELHDMLVPEAGRGNRLQGRDYVAAKRLRGQRYSNLIERALKQAGPNTLEKGKATTLTKEQAADVRLMMVNEHYFAMFPELQPLASRLREISDGIWHDLRNAGFDIGYTRNGHLPRIYDVPKAEVDMPGFVAAATEVYKAAGLSKDEARAAAGDWYFRLTAGNPHSFDQHSPAGDFLKGRTLPPDADVLMADFMVNEPIDLMHRYAASAAQRIEWAQRFGVDNSKLNKMYDQMAREGVDRRDIATIATMMDIMAGQNPLRQKNPTLNAAGAWFNTIYSTVALLPRAVFQSGAEAITASAVMENPVYGVKGMIDLVAGALGTASAKERREIGELIGLIDIGNSTRLMSDRFGGSYDDPLPVQKISASLFTRTGLIALTRAQKTHGMGTANAYLIHLSRNLLKAKPESADAREVQARFNELGIRDAEGFAKWMTSHGGSIMGFGGKMPAKAELTAGLEENGTAPWAHDWITAQRRLSDRVIQDPHEMTKPMLSHAGNIGRLLTGIQAFNYSFYENVIKPVVKRAAERGSDGRYSHAAWKAIVGGLLGFASIYVGQLLFTTLRVYLTDRERWNAEEAKGNLSKYLSRRTLSGFGTPVDPLVQAVTGLKYRRPLGASVEGPAAGNFLANMSDVIALGFASNSRTTNTSEYNALNGAYRLLSPWASAATTAVPGGPLANAAMGMGQGYITSPQAGKDFATTIVGPKNRTVGEDGEKVKSGPTAYDIWLDKHYPKPPKK